MPHSFLSWQKIPLIQGLCVDGSTHLSQGRGIESAQAQNHRGERNLLEGQESGLNKAKCHCLEKAEEILEVWPGCT